MSGFRGGGLDKSSLNTLGGLGSKTLSGLGSYETRLVRSIKGVDEWVYSGAVSTRGDNSSVELVERGSRGVLGSKSSSVGVELEVTVGGIMRVDEGVEVGVNRGIIVIIISNLLNGRYLNWGSYLDRCGRGRRVLSSKRCGVKSVSSSGNMRTIKNSESILASGVFNVVGLTIVSNIRILSNSLSFCSSLLSEHYSILLSICRSEPSISSIESLFLEDLGILGVNKLTSGGRSQARCYYKFKHDIYLLIDNLLHF